MKSVEGSREVESPICKQIESEDELSRIIGKEKPVLLLLFTNTEFPNPVVQRESLFVFKLVCKEFPEINFLWGYTEKLPVLKKFGLGIYRPIYLFFDKGGALVYRVSGYTLTERELGDLLKRMFYEG